MYQYQNALKLQLYEAMMMHDYVENYLLHPKDKNFVISSLSGGKHVIALFISIFCFYGGDAALHVRYNNICSCPLIITY
jgi:hypothetical protein